MEKTEDAAGDEYDAEFEECQTHQPTRMDDGRLRCALCYANIGWGDNQLESERNRLAPVGQVETLAFDHIDYEETGRQAGGQTVGALLFCFFSTRNVLINAFSLHYNSSAIYSVSIAS